MSEDVPLLGFGLPRVGQLGHARHSTYRGEADLHEWLRSSARRAWQRVA